MASENPHHSSLHGADSLSYGENQPRQTPSSSSGLHTYEQRVEASGLGGDRYRSGAEHPTQRAAHESLSAPGADGSKRTNPDGTFRTPQKNRPAAGRRRGTSSASSSDEEGRAAGASTGLGAQKQAGGDSKTGKMMEKLGKTLHSEKLAQKGEVKREKTAGAGAH